MEERHEYSEEHRRQDHKPEIMPMMRIGHLELGRVTCNVAHGDAAFEEGTVTTIN